MLVLDNSGMLPVARAAEWDRALFVIRAGPSETAKKYWIHFCHANFWSFRDPNRPN
jgi:hypothetical protein